MEERDLLDRLDIKKIGENTYEVRDLETGEILDKNDPRLDLVIDEYEKIIEINEANKKAVKKAQGKVDLSETHYTAWKKKSHFIKIYRTEMREYKRQVKLSPSSGLILLYLQDYIEYGTNKIAKANGVNLNNSDIERLTGLSTKTISSSLKELEEKLFIKRIGVGSAREIYFNPHLACPGNEVEIRTVDILFKDYKAITSY